MLPPHVRNTPQHTTHGMACACCTCVTLHMLSRRWSPSTAACSYRNPSSIVAPGLATATPSHWMRVMQHVLMCRSHIMISQCIVHRWDIRRIIRLRRHGEETQDAMSWHIMAGPIMSYSCHVMSCHVLYSVNAEYAYFSHPRFVSAHNTRTRMIALSTRLDHATRMLTLVVRCDAMLPSMLPSSCVICVDVSCCMHDVVYRAKSR